MSTLGAQARVSTELLEGEARQFESPPEVVAYANTEHVSPPDEIGISDSGSGVWRHYEWIALMDESQWIEAEFSNDKTSNFGVQFFGDSNDGWARVLLDGDEVWRGDTYGDPDFIKYLEISGVPAGQHVVRVECLGEAGGGGSTHVCVYFFGLTVSPETDWMSQIDAIIGSIPGFSPVSLLLGLAFTLFLVKRRVSLSI
ncbi:hypothetical protein JXL21_08965 [Candidatus Bathyarchaeota archaeon]|nr:hypothetical protein [Candidatus Bathyarchaeota archaeon]